MFFFYIYLFKYIRPCQVNTDGNDTIPYPYHWNKHANLLFLDQVSKK